MTPRWGLTVLLLLIVLTALTTADGPPLQRSGLRRDSKAPREDVTASPLEASGTGREASAQSMLQQVAQGVFPASLWVALPGWPPAPHVPLNTAKDNYTHLEESSRKWLGPVFNFYMPDTTNVSWGCKRDVTTFYIELFRGKQWAVRMVDSWGKFPDGLLGGNTWVTGLLDECLEISADQELPQAHFTGQYCAISYISKESVGKTTRAKQMEPSLRIASVTGSLGIPIPMSLYGTCIPSSCTREEYGDGLRAHLEKHKLELDTLACQTKDLPTMQYSAADVIMIVTLSLMGVLVLLGTAVDGWVMYTGRTHQDTGPLRYVLVFSFYTNLKKIFSINVNESVEVISCLHGIRVLSMAWVVLGHTYLMSVNSSANKVQMINMVTNNPYRYQVIMNAAPSVDTFFMMSGLLVAYNLTREFNRTQKFNIPVYYIHRFLRLSPAILFLCGVFAVFPPLVVRGALSPLMTEAGYMVDLCRRYWWRDGLFLSNWFFSGAGSDLVETETCMPVCWFTAVDFQLYIVTPLMFLPILYRRKLGAAWLTLMLLASVVIPAIITGIYELPPTTVVDMTPQTSMKYVQYVYMKPWCRASPYLVGLSLGYFLRVVNKEKMQLKWWQAVLGWVAALAIMTVVVLGLKDYNTLSGKPHEYVPAISILYGSLHHLAWGVAVAWMVFACHMGYGGPINSLLGHPFWQPVSRLTYTIFLIAFNAQFFVMYYMIQIPTYASDFNLVMEAAGMLVLSGCGAVLLSLLTESPVLGLEKLILRRGM